MPKLKLKLISVALVEDEEDWVGEFRKLFNQFGIVVTHFKSGDEFMNFTRGDEADPYKAILIDWMMPGMSGPELAQQLRAVKPYLKLFAITSQVDHDEIARVMGNFHFDGFLSKGSLDNEEKVRNFVQKIEQGVRETEELLICRPFASKPEHRAAYLALRGSKNWGEVNERIGEQAGRLCGVGAFSRGRTLRESLPTKRSSALLMENILIARRVILGEIFNFAGKLHEVEQAVGYEEEPGLTYDDPYKMYDAAFKGFCSELGLKCDKVRNSGEGILPEEERWLRGFCEREEIGYAFPVV